VTIQLTDQPPSFLVATVMCVWQKSRTKQNRTASCALQFYPAHECRYDPETNALSRTETATVESSISGNLCG
jgi:hypothetical protein